MIRPAIPLDADALTQISFSSKSVWGYPESYIYIWKDELTITPQYIKDNEVYIYEHENRQLAFYSLLYLSQDLKFSGASLKAGYWLDHMFVAPDSLKKGIGSSLFDHLLELSRQKNISILSVLADPNAKGFYMKKGFSYIEDIPSTIPGRTTPLLTLNIT